MVLVVVISYFYPHVYDNINLLLFNIWDILTPYSFFLQVIMLYIMIKLFYASNPYKKIFILFFFLITQAMLIFYYQAEVYACFLLVNELMVLFFFFLLMIYKGYDNKEPLISGVYLPTLISLLCLFFLLAAQSPLILYDYDDADGWEWIDYYVLTLSPSFNDLIAPFYFFFIHTPQTLLLVGFFLFILSIVYLYLFFRILSMHNPNLFKQNNNTQAHTFRKPTINSYKSTYNDL